MYMYMYMDGSSVRKRTCVRARVRARASLVSGYHESAVHFSGTFFTLYVCVHQGVGVYGVGLRACMPNHVVPTLQHTLNTRLQHTLNTCCNTPLTHALGMRSNGFEEEDDQKERRQEKQGGV